MTAHPETAHKLSPSQTHIIAGGGLAGLFTAKSVLHLGDAPQVHLIEKEPHTGGLMRSLNVQNPLGDGVDYDFDYGTHFVLSTADDTINTLLKEDLNPAAYHTYTGSLKEGQYLNGQLYQNSGCPNACLYPDSIQQAIKEEIEQLIAGPEQSATSLYEQCCHRYGKTATETILVPAFEKFTGLHPRDLPAGMENFFCPSRIIIADRDTSLAMKQDPAWDWRIAYANCTDNESEIVKYYARSGGVGRWLEDVTHNLQQTDAAIHTGTAIEHIQHNGNRIESVTLSNGQTLPCDVLYWTLPAIFLAKMTGTDIPSAKPQMRAAATVHFLTDKRPVEMPYWITVYDPDITAYRVTLYDNFAPTTQGQHRITVEILHDGEFEGTDEDCKAIFQELITMGIIPDTAQCLWSDYANKANGFPVYTHNLLQALKAQIEILEGTFSNLRIVGRRPDLSGHGQIPIMHNVYTTVQKTLSPDTGPDSATAPKPQPQS